MTIQHPESPHLELFVASCIGIDHGAPRLPLVVGLPPCLVLLVCLVLLLWGLLGGLESRTHARFLCGMPPVHCPCARGVVQHAHKVFNTLFDLPQYGTQCSVVCCALHTSVLQGRGLVAKKVKILHRHTLQKRYRTALCC